VDKAYVLELYDQDRKHVEIPDMQREGAPHVVRHVSAEGEGLVIYSDLNAGSADRVISEQVSHFQGRDLTWIVYGHDRPADLKERLLARGFEAEEPEELLVLDLEQVPPALLEPIRHDVRRISQPSELDDVITIHEQVWQESFEGWRARLARRLVDEPESLSLYVAYVDGVAASTAQVSYYVGGMFASLVRAATLPAYRGRGLFTALVTTLVQQARRRGVRFLDTDAGPMSRPILEELGFEWLSTMQSLTLRAGASTSVV
jgi:GNAT superfamily N-acetyltransferase